MTSPNSKSLQTKRWPIIALFSLMACGDDATQADAAMAMNDAMVGEDARVSPDAESMDAGARDGGERSDAGMASDGGTDAGVADAGAGDGGGSDVGTDAGPMDMDAGPEPACIPGSPDAVGWIGYRDRMGLDDSDLTPSSGTLTITQNGEVVELIEHIGRIIVRADDVTIRRSVVRGAGGPDFMIQSLGTGLVIEDVELDGAGDASNLVGRGQYIARRVYAHSPTADAFKSQHHDVELHSVWAWNPRPSIGAHSDALQTQGGDRVTVSCSHLDWRYRGGDFGPVTPHRTSGAGGFGGQGFWGTAGSDDVVLHDSFIASMGYPVGTSGMNWEMCNVVIRSQNFNDRIHPGADRCTNVAWGNVTTLDGSVVTVPTNFTNVRPCP